MIRLKKLEIRNLLSLETTTIDFDEDMGESGLVLICGKTGAGKSTILDAICLALYGRAPRLERAGSEERYGPNNEYKNRDVAQLMRRGAVDAYCSLTFVTTSGDEYEASWEIHRARRQHNGAIQGPNRTLSKVGGDTVEKGVKGAIEEVVGLSYDDFCQTVLLAQGDFSRFLYSSEGERSSILERLTRMEQCTEYGKKIYRIADHYKQKYQRQRLAIDAIQTLSPDDVRKTKAQIRMHTQTVKSRNGEITALSELKTRLAKLSDLEDVLGKYATDRTRLEGLFAGLLTAEKQLTHEAKARKEEMGRLDEEIARCSAAIPMYDREEQIVKSLTKLRGIWLRIEEIKEEKKADRKSLADLRPKQKAKLHSIRELDAQVAKLNRQVEVKEGAYDGYHPKEISDRMEALRDQERFNVLQQSVLESEARLDKLQVDLEKLAADLEVAEEVLKRDEELKKKAEDAVGDAAKRLRQGLSPGDTCPVCGQEIHAELIDREFEELLKPVKERYAESKKKRDDLKTRQDELTVEKKTQAELIRRSREEQQKITRVGLRRGESPEEVKTILTTTRSEISDLAEQKERADELQVEIRQLRRQLDGEGKKSAQESHELKELVAEVSGAKQSLATLRGELASKRDTARNLVAEMDSLIIYPDWQTSLRTDPENLLTTLQSEASDYRTKCQQRSSIESELGSGRAELERIATKRASLASSFPDAQPADYPDKPLLGKVIEQLTRIEAELHTLSRGEEETRRERTRLTTECPDLLQTTADELDKGLSALRTELDRTNTELGGMRATLDGHKRNKMEKRRLETEAEDLAREAARWDELRDLLGDAEGKKLRGIAQGYILRYLLESANEFLVDLGAKYRLTIAPKSSAILVVDPETSLLRQSVTILSGGESFMVALSLSLALSRLRGESVVDTLFMDEGFGTLDPHSLSMVVEALEKLHERMSRRIVLISHVQALRERISTRIEVESIDRSHSRLAVIRDGQKWVRNSRGQKEFGPNALHL